MFPLLKLDLIVFDEVLKHLNPYELFKLACCSIPLFRLVKSYLISADYSLGLSIRPNIKWLIVRHKSNPFKFSFGCINWVLPIVKRLTTSEKWIFMKKKCLIIPIDKGVDFYWEDESGALKILSLGFISLFGKPITHLDYLGDSTDSSLDLLRTILNIQKPIEKAYLSIGSLKKVQVDYILDMLKETENIVVYGADYSDYSLNFKSLRILEGLWVSLDYLVGLGCENLVVEKSSLLGSDINQFLKKWIDGKCSNVSRLSLKLKDTTNLTMVFNGIRFLEGRRDGLKLPSENFTLLGSPFNIQRSTDGKIATVFAGITTTNYKVLSFEMRVLDC